MRLCCNLFCMLLLCGSCASREKKTPVQRWDDSLQVLPPQMSKIWNGNFPLMQNAEEPVCVIWYEPTEGLWNSWYPAKIFSDTNQVRQIINCLYYPENENHYLFKTEKYLLIIGINRSLNSYSMVLVPFLLEQDGYIFLPTGRDQKLYTILASAPEKENFYEVKNIDK